MASSVLSVLLKNDNIVVIGDAQPLEVTPGESATTKFILRNQGPKTSSCQIRTEGVPTAWLTISPAITTLRPSEEKEVVITIQPPRTSKSSAQQHTLSIKVMPDYHTKAINLWC